MPYGRRVRLVRLSQAIRAGDADGDGGGDGSGDGGGGGESTAASGDEDGATDGAAGGTFGQNVLDGAVHRSLLVTHGLNSPGLPGSLV